MASRNQKRPPRSPYGKKDGAEDAPLDKRRRVGARRMAPVDTGALAVANKQDVVVANSCVESVEGSECGTVEFTKEEVEALLNEKLMEKKFDVKGNMERMSDREQIKKLKLCIKWFQQVGESHRLEQEKLKNELELAAKNCSDTEMKLRKKEKDLNSLIADLRKHYNLRVKMAMEGSDKLASQDEAIKQKDSLATEIKCLRSEIQQLRDDRDHHVNQVHTLTAYILKYKEATGKSFTELDSLTIEANALEEPCSSQMEQIRVLKIQLAAANEKLKVVANSCVESVEGSECGTVEFTKEEVEALLNEKLMEKKFDVKGNMERMSEREQIKKLKLCIKWFQQVGESHRLEQEKLKNELELAAKNCLDTEMKLRKKEKDLNSLIADLRKHYNLRVKMSMEGSDKLASQDEAIKQKDSLATEIKCLRSEIQQLRDDRDHHVNQVHTLTAYIQKYKEATGKSITELDSLTIEANALEETCSSQMEQIRVLKIQLAAANEKLKMTDLSSMKMRTEFEKQNTCISELKRQLAEGEIIRKKLHNTILELKGNIRVFCRVRPFLSEEGVGVESSVISYPTSTESLGRGIDVIQSGAKHAFTFDKVFANEASQKDVFEEISQLVQSALDGYKVCIFAYGQTGSGKTYTMMGRPEAPDHKGLIPRSLEQIFQTSQSLASQGWRYTMQASMLEIYNETIRDLLSNRSSFDVTSTESGVAGKQCEIKHDANKNPYVPGLTIIDVCSIKEISSLLQHAAKGRSVGKTNMNEHSSRSHFVFTLRISGISESTNQRVHGVLNLIDLAGSERLSKSGATGDRRKEAVAKNSSLSALGDVIFSLSKKEGHVPFRNSKLTHLLQPYLGGDSKVLMVVNVSPDPSSVGESLCSLRFAARVNACEAGIPRCQTSMQFSDNRMSCG